MKNLFLEAVHLNNAYTGIGMYMGFYYVALLYLYFYSKDKNMRLKIVYPAVLMLCFILCGAPVINTYIASIYDKDTGGRLFWVLLIIPVIAYGIVCIVQRLESYWKKALLILVLMPIIFLSGVFKFSNSLYHPIENEYRLPQNEIEICQAVLEATEKPKLLVPYEIAHVFRQYSTDIRLLYGEDASYGRIINAKEEYVKACNEMDSTTPDVKYVVSLAYNEDCDFVVFDHDYHILDTSPSLYGFDYYMTIDHFDLYRRHE